ncbi:MAG: nucleoside kinase [Bacteroidales bacterium]|nr:nucleoside kinase [Bacteroidales bacterium]
MEKKKIEIYCVNTDSRMEFDAGVTLAEIATALNVDADRSIVGALVNNNVKELSFAVYKPKVVQFFDVNDINGQRMYRRSLTFILAKAVYDVAKDINVSIEHSISKGLYCELHSLSGEDVKPTDELVSKIKKRMVEIVAADYPFGRREILSSEAAKIFAERGLVNTAKMFEKRTIFFSSIYTLDGYDDYYSSYMVPSTGFISVFDLIPFYDGMLLRFPTDFENMEIEQLVMQPKLFDIFREHKSWVELLNISTVASLNSLVEKGRAGDLIKVGEALHEKKIAQIADQIKQAGNIKLVLIAGPSSSGKTTTSMRLCVQLAVAGMRPKQISLDNYFVDRVNTPRNEKGDYDFEALEAVDYKQFNQDILDAMNGKKVEMPFYNFQTGKREYRGDYLTADDDTVFVVEGIHGLNPAMSQMIPADRKFKVYVSALTQIGIDAHNRIPTTYNRLLRRIIRDYKYRGYSAEDTIKRWPDVRRGEERNIFPYQEEADVMFNSALPYELGVIKKYAEPILRNVSERNAECAEAMMLLKFLTYFKEFPDEEIPPTSILREFLSGSSFKY